MTVSLDDNIPPLPADVTATLSSDTLLAPKFVALSAGTPGGKTLANDATIEGHPSYGIEQITAAAGPLFENANKLIDNLNGTVTNLNGDGDERKEASLLVDNSCRNSRRCSIRPKRIWMTYTNILGLDSVEKNANTIFETAGKFLGSTDKQLQDQMKELHVILLNLKVISTHAKAITEALGEKPNRLIFSGKAKTLTPEAEILKSQKPLPATNHDPGLYLARWFRRNELTCQCAGSLSHLTQEGENSVS